MKWLSFGQPPGSITSACWPIPPPSRTSFAEARPGHRRVLPHPVRRGRSARPRIALAASTTWASAAGRLAHPLRSGVPGRPHRGTRAAGGRLDLPGPTPLLGLEQVRGSPTVIVIEGVFDWLTLCCWGYPAVALLGTHTRPDTLEHLRAFQRVYLVLDQDDAGLEATLRLSDALGARAVPVELPEGVHDLGELAPRADGRAVFAGALLEAVGACTPENV